MLIKKYNSEQEWLDDRRTRITGTKLKEISGVRGGRKLGFYQLIADRISVGDGTSDRERGHELEAEAIEQLGNVTNLTFITDLCMWVRDDNPNMAYSPDGYTKNLKVAAEAKCLGSARHLEIIDTDKIPSEFMPQIIQGFIVNDKLERTFFISYDNRIIARPYHIIEKTRKELADEIAYYKDFEERTLKQIEGLVEEWAF